MKIIIKRFFINYKSLIILFIIATAILIVFRISALFLDPYKLIWILIPLSFIVFLIYTHPWRTEIDKLPMPFLCFSYLSATIIPSLFPAIAIGGVFDLPIEEFIIVASIFTIIALLIHSFYLSKELKLKEEKDKIRLLEKVKAALSVSLPIFGLGIVFRLNPNNSNAVIFLLNSFLLLVAILNAYRGYIELKIFGIKYPKEINKKEI